MKKQIKTLSYILRLSSASCSIKAMRQNTVPLPPEWKASEQIPVETLLAEYDTAAQTAKKSSTQQEQIQNTIKEIRTLLTERQSAL